jgi:hypothetical protein
VVVSGDTITVTGPDLSSYATQSYVNTQISNTVDSAPETLNTLNELAAALGDDANFATTTSTALGNRLRVDTASQGLTATQKSNAKTNLGLATVATSGAYSDITGTPTIPTNNTQLTNGAGYLTSFTETNDLSSAVTWANVPDANITQGSVTQHQAALSITESQVSDLGSYITASSTETLTNKTLTSPQINTQIDVLAQGQLRLQDSSGGQYVALRAPATVGSSVTFSLPSADGTSGQVLATDGSGNFSFADAGSGGSGSSYPNSTTSTMPSSGGDYDLAKDSAQSTAETPFEEGGTDAFGVNLGTVFDMMDPTGTTETTDLGADEAYVGA